MSFLRNSLIILGLLLMGYHSFLYFRINESEIAKAVSGGAPARFIQADEQTLKEINEALKMLKPIPDYVLNSPKQKDFGRRELFLPDSEKISFSEG